MYVCTVCVYMLLEEMLIPVKESVFVHAGISLVCRCCVTVSTCT